MSYLRQIGWALALLGIWTSCIDQIEVDLLDRSQLLVVNGKLTDQPGPHSVQLTWSIPLDSLVFIPIIGSRVSIAEEGGNSVQLREVEPGLYQTEAGEIQGEIGKRYQLQLSLANGQVYESDWMEVRKSPPIDSLYYELETRPTLEGPETGMQLYVDTRDPENKTRYYRWEWEETWKYDVPFPFYQTYLGNNQVSYFEPNEFCWRQLPPQEISIATSSRNTIDAVVGHPLHFISTRGPKLLLRYSILVRQFSIDETEYFFWKNLQESAANGSGLYEQQPQSVAGNIRNVADVSEPVLGYFSASATTEKRVYINRNEIQALVDQPYTIFCNDAVDTIPRSVFSEDSIRITIRDGKNFYDFYRDQSEIVGYLMVPPFCGDCLARGGDTLRPDFWID